MGLSRDPRKFRKIKYVSYLTYWRRKHSFFITDRSSQQDVNLAAVPHNVRRRQKAAPQRLPPACYSSGLVRCVFVLIADRIPRGSCSIWVSSGLQLERAISQEIPETDKRGHQQGSRVNVKQRRLWLTPQCGSFGQLPSYMWLFEKIGVRYLSLWLTLGVFTVSVYCKNQF